MKHRSRLLPTTACAVLALSGFLHADFLTGRVVDQNGVGVPGVDIDFKSLSGGGRPSVFNDGTDPNGFFTVTVPNGQYRVTFTPPPPPTTTLLVTEVDDVTIVGTLNMGNVVLPAGVSVGAHVQDAGGLPVVGLNIDVIDLSSGDNLTLANDFTDIFGNFQVAVPAGPIELRMDSTPVIGPTLASRAIQLSPSANTTLPTQVLPPGFTLSGFVQRTGGIAVPDVDLDAHDSVTGQKLYTPGDSTAANGAFSFVVPAGTYDISVCPDPALLLVAQGIDGLTVSASTSLGTFTLASGVLLLGNVKTAGGTNVVGGDIDVDLAAGGKVVTCGDSTDGAGNYAVVVPTGNLVVTFSPPDWSQPWGRDVRSVAVSGTQLLNGTLPSCPFPTNYGTGLAGTGGFVPHIAGLGGAPSAGNGALGVSMENGIGGGITVLITALVPLNVPLFGGTLLAHVDPSVSTLYAFSLDGAVGVGGAGSATFDFPPVGAFVGLTAYCQFLVRDFGAPAGWALSEGLQFTICP